MHTRIKSIRQFTGSNRPMVVPLRQRGAVLIVAMIFLLLITIVAVVGSRRSTLELQMAGNDQARQAYFEYANSVVDELRGKMKQDGGNYPGDGEKFCNVGSVYADCDSTNLSVDKTYLADEDTEVNYSIQKKGTAGSNWVVQDNSKWVSQQDSDGSTISADGANPEEANPFAIYAVRADVVGNTSKTSSAAIEQGFMRFEPDNL